MKFQSKLPDLEITIFSVMTQLANEHGAINLSQGFPDFDPPAEIRQAAIEAIRPNLQRDHDDVELIDVWSAHHCLGAITIDCQQGHHGLVNLGTVVDTATGKDNTNLLTHRKTSFSHSAPGIVAPSSISVFVSFRVPKKA